MGNIDKNRNFERSMEQSTPTNPTGNTDIDTNKYDIEKNTINEQQNKQ